MKKIFFVFALAGMFGFAACNNTEPVENDTVDTTVEVIMIDSLDAVDTVL